MSRHAYTQEQLRLAVAIGRVVGLTMENMYLLESRMHSERMAVAGETVAHLSHYIRNILQGMQGGAEIVEQGLERRSLDMTESGWALIRRNLDRILQLTVNMLTFSKKRRPKAVMAPINPVIEEALGLVKKRADEKSVRIVTDLEEMPPVPLDLDGIHQVVNNIVLNAVQAAPEGAGRVGISTSYLEDEDVVKVSINDNGPGIPKEEINRIFNAFHSTKGHGGTGLGLAAASKIVRELRGTIEVESAIGRGTTFHIKLPLTPDDPTDTGE
jgi:signal transduction histidine kinase